MYYEVKKNKQHTYTVDCTFF